MTASAAQPRRRPWYRPSLTVQIMIGLVVGGVIGWLRPDWGNAVYFLRDIFINLIKSIIAPLVFSTIVVGIAGAGALRKVGRMGIKALIYFEIVTTAALVHRIGRCEFHQAWRRRRLSQRRTRTPCQSIEQTHPQTFVETIVHAFPSSIIEAMVRGDVLQIVAFSVLFALAVSAVGEKGKPIVRAMESLSQVMFKFTNYVMMFAPIGVGAAMAHTIGTQGLGVLMNLGKLVLSLYLALDHLRCCRFWSGDSGSPACRCESSCVQCASRPRWHLRRRAASRRCLKPWNRWNVWACPRHIVGFVMPTGYSFNLDGSTLYLAMASVFVAQAAETTTGQHMWLGQQIVMMLTLMITSKGVAARAARVTGDLARDGKQLLARRPRTDRRGGHLWRR